MIEIEEMEMAVNITLENVAEPSIEDLEGSKIRCKFSFYPTN
jgi:hypothetical protein